MDEQTRLLLLDITLFQIELAEEILKDWADLPPRFRDFLDAAVGNLKGYQRQLQNDANNSEIAIK